MTKIGIFFFTNFVTYAQTFSFKVVIKKRNVLILFSANLIRTANIFKPQNCYYRYNFKKSNNVEDSKM